MWSQGFKTGSTSLDEQSQSKLNSQPQFPNTWLEVVENKVSQAFVVAQVVCDGFCSFHYLYVKQPRHSKREYEGKDSQRNLQS